MMWGLWRLVLGYLTRTSKNFGFGLLTRIASLLCRLFLYLPRFLGMR